MGKQHIEKGGVFCAVLTNWLPLRLELTLQELSFFFFFNTGDWKTLLSSDPGARTYKNTRPGFTHC